MSHEHGTYSAYAVDRCRCEPCRTRQNERVAANRAARLARVEQLEHGIRSTYDAGCRCTKCQQVRAKASVRETALRRERFRAAHSPSTNRKAEK